MSGVLSLTFTGTTISAGDTLNINITTATGNLTLVETFVNLRSANYQVTLSLVGTPVENGYATNYTTAFNLDYNDTGFNNNLVASSVAAVVTITMQEPSWQIASVTGTAVDSGAVTAVINNDPVEDVKSFTLDSYATSSGNECSQVDVNLLATGGDDAYDIYQGQTLLASGEESPITVTLARGLATGLRCYDTTGTEIGRLSLVTPRKLIVDDISVSISNLAAGATVTVSVPFIATDMSPYEYSINGTDYQDAGVFTGIANGTYTIYVRDSFGCITSRPNVVIDGTSTSPETTMFISEINALRFFRMESGKKNYANSISCKDLKPLSYKFQHLFLSTDEIPTQFKTNAAYINCFTVDSDGTTDTLTEVKRTENMGQRAKSTCTYFNLSDGRSGVYFGVVDILDYDTDDFIKETDFGFTLPEWANTEGKYVNLDGVGEVEIDAIGYSETYQAFILEFNFAYTGDPVEINLSAIYDLNPYEIYEVEFLMNDQPEQFNLVIQVGTSSDNIEFTYVSEEIKRVVDEEFLFHIQYHATENIGGMNYQTGIRHSLRLKGRTNYEGDQSSEGYAGDTQYFTTNNSVYNSQNFKFFRLPDPMAHKLRLVVPHEFLTINGQSFNFKEEPDVSGNENTNLKTFSVTLSLGGDALLNDPNEIITNTPENDAIAGAIEASEGKALLLWTKTNG